jgi:hypothetical protein
VAHFAAGRVETKAKNPSAFGAGSREILTVPWIFYPPRNMKGYFFQ